MTYIRRHQTIKYRYALPCGEEGSLLSLPKPLYIASIDTVANRMAVLDREGKPHILSVTTAEYRFKAAVVAGREQEAVEVVFKHLCHCEIVSRYFYNYAGGQNRQTFGTGASQILGQCWKTRTCSRLHTGPFVQVLLNPS